MAGFCVLELLLAAFLAAVALGGAVQLIGNAARVHRMAREQWVQGVEQWNEVETAEGEVEETDSAFFPLDGCPGLRRWSVGKEEWEVWKSEIGRLHLD